MNYKKFLRKVEKKLKKEDISKNEKNRLIVIRASLKQIIFDKEKKVPERTRINNLQKILSDKRLYDIDGKIYFIHSADIFSGMVYTHLIDENGKKVDNDCFYEESLKCFQEQLREEIPSARVIEAPDSLGDVTLLIKFMVEK